MGKQFTVIELDKHRNLRYGYKALIEIEEMLGLGISKINFGALRLRDMAIIIYCGLKHEDEDLTVDKVIDIIDANSDIESVTSKLAEAIENAFGDEPKKKTMTKPK